MSFSKTAHGESAAAAVTMGVCVHMSAHDADHPLRRRKSESRGPSRTPSAQDAKGRILTKVRNTPANAYHLLCEEEREWNYRCRTAEGWSAATTTTHSDEPCYIPSSFLLLFRLNDPEWPMHSIRRLRSLLPSCPKLRMVVPELATCSGSHRCDKTLPSIHSHAFTRRGIVLQASRGRFYCSSNWEKCRPLDERKC